MSTLYQIETASIGTKFEAIVTRVIINIRQTNEERRQAGEPIWTEAEAIAAVSFELDGEGYQLNDLIETQGNQRVCIITVANRGENGQFDKHIASVWSNIDAARQELKRIQDSFDNNPECNQDWRAKHPIGQIDDLSIERLVGNHYQCQSFYRILSKPVDKKQ